MMLGAFLSFLPSNVFANETAISRLVQTKEAARMEKIVQLPKSDRRSVACMALAIYHESKSEPLQGQRAVGHAIINRMKSPKYPDTACGVVFEKYRGRPQFVFVSKRALIPSNTQQWSTALKVAYSVFSGASADPTRGATSFYNPRLSSKRKPGVTIGHHVFHRG